MCRGDRFCSFAAAASRKRFRIKQTRARIRKDVQLGCLYHRSESVRSPRCADGKWPKRTGRAQNWRENRIRFFVLIGQFSTLSRMLSSIAREIRARAFTPAVIARALIVPISLLGFLHYLSAYSAKYESIGFSFLPRCERDGCSVLTQCESEKFAPPSNALLFLFYIFISQFPLLIAVYIKIGLELFHLHTKFRINILKYKNRILADLCELRTLSSLSATGECN